MAARVERLPYTVGRLTGGWYVLIAVLLALVGLGVYAYSRQLVAGELVTGMRDIGTMGGAPWGLYVAFDAYFVGVGSAALAVAVLIRLLNLAVLRPIARIAQVLAVITIILGAFSILADLGQPARGILNFLRYARPQSPFFGTFTWTDGGMRPSVPKCRGGSRGSTGCGRQVTGTPRPSESDTLASPSGWLSPFCPCWWSPTPPWASSSVFKWAAPAGSAPCKHPDS
jgi:hypothetical protein